MGIKQVIVLRIHTKKSDINAVLAMIDPTFNYEPAGNSYAPNKDTSLLSDSNKILLERYFEKYRGS